MEEVLIRTLISAVEGGLRADMGYKAEAWKRVLQAIQGVTQQAVLVKQLKSKHDNMKRDWRVWKDLLNQPGLRKDENGCITADRAVLEPYMRAHPEARRFQNAPLKFQELLDQLFHGFYTTDLHAYTPADRIDPALQYSRGAEPTATPCSATTIRCSSASSNMKRGAEDVADKESSQRAVTKRPTESISEMVEEAQASRLDKQEKAVQLFFSEFGELDIESQVTIVNQFQSEQKAKIYILLPSKAVRQAWINRELERV